MGCFCKVGGSWKIERKPHMRITCQIPHKVCNPSSSQEPWSCEMPYCAVKRLHNETQTRLMSSRCITASAELQHNNTSTILFLSNNTGTVLIHRPFSRWWSSPSVLIKKSSIWHQKLHFSPDFHFVTKVSALVLQTGLKTTNQRFLNKYCSFYSQSFFFTTYPMQVAGKLGPIPADFGSKVRYNLDISLLTLFISKLMQSYGIVTIYHIFMNQLFGSAPDGKLILCNYNFVNFSLFPAVNRIALPPQAVLIRIKYSLRE